MARREAKLFAAILCPVIAILAAGCKTAPIAAARQEDTVGTKLDTLEQVVEAARGLGFPWTAADFQRDPPIRANENVALAVLPAAKGIPLREEWFTSVAPFGTQSQDAALRKALLPINGRLDDIKAGAEKFGWYVDRDWDLGTILPFPDLAYTRTATRALACRAVVRAADGDLDGSLSDLAAGRNLASHVATEPSSVAMLASLGMYQITNFAAVRIAELWQDDTRRLIRLATCLDEHGGHFDPEGWMMFEIYIAVTYCRNLPLFRELNEKGLIGDGPPPKVDPQRLIRDGLPEGELAKATLYSALYFWVTGYTDEWHEEGFRPGWGARLNKFVKAYREEGDAIDKTASLYFPDFELMEAAVQRGKGMEAMTRALVANLRYRNANGHFAPSLAELRVSDADPLDANRKLIYQVTPNGFSLYSVGKNGQEDGGPRAKRPDGNPVDDFGVVFPAAKPQASSSREKG